MQRIALGVDLGGTKIEVARVREDGTILADLRVPTGADRPGELILEDVAVLLQKLWTPEVCGIGLGTPGFLTKEGFLTNAPNTPTLQGDMLLASFFAQRFSVPVFHENDANCFALAEYLYGAGKGTSSLLGVIWGTGVGGGMVIDGKLIHGYSRGAFEIGHMILDRSSSVRCNCGRLGDVESLCRGAYLLERYHTLGGTNPEITVKELMESEDPVARQVATEALDTMALALANWCHMVSPERVVFGGGFSKSPIYAHLNRAFQAAVIPALGREVDIVQHGISDSSGVVGAAALVFSAK